MADTDDMYPSSTEFFLHTDAPKEQKEELRKEQGKSMAAVPKLKEILAELDADIEFFSSIDSINTQIQTKPDEFLKAWHIQQELKSYAQAKKEWIEQMIPDNLR